MAVAPWLLCTLGMRRLRYIPLVLSVSAAAPNWTNGGFGGPIYLDENVPVLQQPVRAAPNTASTAAMAVAVMAKGCLQ